MGKKRTQKQSKPQPGAAELRFILWNRFFDLLIYAARSAAWVGPFYFGYRSIQSLAGESTFADIGVNFMTSLTVSKGVAYVFGAGGLAWGFAERRLRRKTIQQLSPERVEYEKARDPRRTSSRLTPIGTTRPEDE